MKHIEAVLASIGVFVFLLLLTNFTIPTLFALVTYIAITNPKE